MGYTYKAMVLSVIVLMTLCRQPVYAATEMDVRKLVNGNSVFAFDLYQRLCVSDNNLFLSPHSISTALAMTYAGARGNTEKQMATTLRFSFDQEQLHQVFAEFESILNEPQKCRHITLSIANSLWPQQDYKFLDEYLYLIKKHYGVSITPVDYMRAHETARQIINRWVQDNTQDKIRNLIKPGILDALTRLVLVNAIYFKGNWENQFKTSQTKDALFFTAPGKSIQTPLMMQRQEFRYAELKLLKIIELPYAGNELSMFVLLPKTIDGLRQLESVLSVEALEQWKRCMIMREVRVFLPRFKMTSQFRLDKTLVSMGMIDAFSKGKANFSAMDGRPNWLYIAAVIHKAFVEVNEEGTEAAAATAVVMKETAVPAPPPLFRADHPFLFLICEKQTGSILFMGRVYDPSKTEE